MTDIVQGTMQQFKTMIESSLGRGLEPSDIAVIKDKNLFFDRVDAIQVGDFVNEMLKFNKANFITNKDVIVISANDLNDMETDNVAEVKNGNTGTKLKR